MTAWPSIEQIRTLHRATSVDETSEEESIPSKNAVDDKVSVTKNGLRYLQLRRGTQLWHGTHGLVPFGSINLVNEPPVLNMWKKYSPIAEYLPAFYKATNYVDSESGYEAVYVDYPVDAPPTIKVSYSRPDGRRGRWSATDIM